MFARLAIPLLLIAATSSASGRKMPFEKGIRLILDEYLQVYGALCRAGAGRALASTRRKIAKAARRIERLSGRLVVSKRDVARGRRQRWVKQTVGEAASTLRRVRDLVTIRDAYGKLSRALATWAVRANLAQVNVVYFARTKRVWLQRGREIRSPYVGFGTGHSGLVVAGPDKGWTSEETVLPGDPAQIDRREGQLTVNVEGLPPYLRSR